MAMDIPVYVFTGFLESGKTTFIRGVLNDPNFTEDERTLLFVCEEGVEEYDEAVLAASRTTLVPVEDQASFTREFVAAWQEKTSADRVLIEYNGMWRIPALQDVIPEAWDIYQIVATVDSASFKLYMDNMGDKLSEILMNADLIVFNRSTEETKQIIRRRNIRLLNRQADIFFEAEDGASEDYRDKAEMPFDKTADVIDIGNDDFGLWYMDAMDHPEDYDAKTVQFLGMVYHAPNVPEGTFVMGRFAMVCCANDPAFIGVLCRGVSGAEYQTREWAHITAKIRCEESALYRGKGPVLYVRSMEPGLPPKDDLVYFN